MFTLNTQDFNNGNTYGVHHLTVLKSKPVEELEGFVRFHENCMYRQGMVNVIVDGQYTRMFCREDYSNKLEMFTYSFSV